MLVLIAGAAGSAVSGGTPATTIITASGVIIAATVAAITSIRIQRRNERTAQLRRETEQQEVEQQRRREAAADVLAHLRDADDALSALSRSPRTRTRVDAGARALRTAADLALLMLPAEESLQSSLQELTSRFDRARDAAADQDLTAAIALYRITHSRVIESLARQSPEIGPTSPIRTVARPRRHSSIARLSRR